MPETILAVFVVLVFIMPGFVWQRVYASFVPQRFATDHHFVMECLTRSAVIHAIFSPLSIMAYLKRWDSNHPYWLASYGAIVLLLAPLFLGSLAAKALKGRRTPNWISKLGLNFIYPIPTAWDWLFWNVKAPTIALVTLKNGSKAAGGFSPNSFVGDSHHERDIFLEKAIKADAMGCFQGVQPGSEGVWIASSEIAIIEFFSVGGTTNGKRQGEATEQVPGRAATRQDDGGGVGGQIRPDSDPR